LNTPNAKKEDKSSSKLSSSSSSSDHSPGSQNYTYYDYSQFNLKLQIDERHCSPGAESQNVIQTKTRGMPLLKIDLLKPARNGGKHELMS